MAELPTGTVTFLFTDIEGSTRLLRELGDDYAGALAEHRRVLREAFARHGGVEVDTQGDAFFVAFARAGDALAAAQAGQAALAAGPVRVRMGIHTGTPELTGEGYVGLDVHLGARIAAAGHGGQVLLSKAAGQLAADDLRDLGEHRLKDFDDPVWIFQLGSKSFPPLKTISNTNLPRPASSFVGRERELVEVVSLLGNGVRLLTLSGPGGSGKTRLAIEAAAELVPEFKNGVFWIGLAPLRDPELVIETIGQALGAKEELAAHIAERELLLLLDNFEQVVEAAPQLATLVERCPNLGLLVTSRELLRVRGEVEYTVPPLAEPDAVELFCARARLDPNETIADLCRRLDNLPLAVELAAACTSVLSPAQILERLAQRLDFLKGGRDADTRHATLRATIEWSHDLLAPEEQRLFARLAVFAGGWTLEAAEAVVGADLETLQSLVEKSLVRHTNERFWMLETIREFAWERLEGRREVESLARRHAAHYAALAERAEAELWKVEAALWGATLAAEHDNLRAALSFARDTEDGELLLRIAGALGRRFWGERGHLREGRAWLEEALSVSERPADARALALAALSELVWMQGDEARAIENAEAEIAFARVRKDTEGIRHGLTTLGHVAAARGELDRAWALYEESANYAGRAPFMAATGNLAFVAIQKGDYERALELSAAVLAGARDGGDKWVEAVTLNNIAYAAFQLGRFDMAAERMRESIRAHAELGATNGLFYALVDAASMVGATGSEERAGRLLGASDALGTQCGYVLDPNNRAIYERTLAGVRAGLRDRADAALAEGRAMSLDEAVAYALESLD